MTPAAPSMTEACAGARRDEQACLGAALGNDEAARLVCSLLRSSQFASDVHQQVHTAISSLVVRGEGVDVLTVAAEVERTSGWCESYNGDYLHLLAENVPAAAHARQYCERVAELARQRELRRHLQGAEVACQGATLSVAERRGLRQELAAATALLDGAAVAAARLPLFDGPALAAMRLDEPQPLCEGLIYRGCSTDLVAEPKRGKTTLLLDVARTVTGGESWCGRATQATGVLYLAEQSPHSFNPQVARAGLLGERNFVTLFHRDALALSWPEIGEQVLRAARERALDLVVIDNLSLWAGIAGDEENDAGVALGTLRVVERLTGAGLAVVAVRHARKGGGSISEAGRGSSAIAGGFDILGLLKGDLRPRRRTLVTTGRIFSAEPPPLTIELDADVRYRLVGEGSAVRRADARAFILGRLPCGENEALPEAELLAAAQEEQLGKSVVQEELRGLVDAAAVRRARGAGAAAANAYGYWRCPGAA